jgi:peptidoglycan/xylan/chitin deacetylase (PgdA/CDA1 family)
VTGELTESDRRRLMVVMACLVAMAVVGCGTEKGAVIRQVERGTSVTATPIASVSPEQALRTESPSPSPGVSTAGPDPTTGAGVTATAPAAPKGLPSLVRTGPADRPRVALTFDADMTPAMLRRLGTGEVGSYYNAALIAELRRLQVPATLFLTGLWMQHYQDVTRDLAADPLFELGTHTWQHGAFTADCYGLPVTPPSQMMEEVLRAQRLLDELAGGRSTRLFRFPGGCYDRAALRAISRAGVTAVQFDVEGGDGFQPRPAAIVRGVVSGAQNGSIVVLHMNGANTSPRTADAVGPIAEQLRRQGYVLTTVSGLFTPNPQPATPPRQAER